jgi:hypothetical protein
MLCVGIARTRGSESTLRIVDNASADHGEHRLEIRKPVHVNVEAAAP